MGIDFFIKHNHKQKTLNKEKAKPNMFYPFLAITSISTLAPFGISFTANALLAG